MNPWVCVFMSIGAHLVVEWYGAAGKFFYYTDTIHSLFSLKERLMMK